MWKETTTKKLTPEQLDPILRQSNVSSVCSLTLFYPVVFFVETSLPITITDFAAKKAIGAYNGFDSWGHLLIKIVLL